MGKIHVYRECGKGYTQANDLSRHRFDKHHPRLCRWCDYQSSRVYLIRQHVQRHHPSITLDRENNKVWRFPEDSVEVLPKQPQLPPRMPLRDTTNLQQVDAYVTIPTDNRRVVASTSQSDRRSVIAYSPGPAVNPMLTYVPGNKVMVLSPLHPNPDASQAATPTRTSPPNMLPLSLALSEWRDGGDDYTIEEVPVVLVGSHADQAGVSSSEGSLAAPDLDVMPVASPGSPAPGSDDGPVDTCGSAESSPGKRSAPDGTALSSPPCKAASPTWEALGVSLLSLLGQYQECGHPYTAEVQEKADNYERLLAQYKCRPYTEECSTLASSSCTVSLMLPPGAALIADTSTVDVSLTAGAPTPGEALMDDVQTPGMLLSADASTSSESLTTDSSNPEVSLLSSGPTPDALLPSSASTTEEPLPSNAFTTGESLYSSTPTTSGESLHLSSPAAPGVSLPSSTSATAASLPSSTPAPGVSLPLSTSATAASLPSSTPAPGVSLPSSTSATAASLPSSTPAPGVSLPSSKSVTAASLPSSTPAPGESLPSSTPAPGESFPSSAPALGVFLPLSTPAPGESLTSSAPSSGVFLPSSAPTMLAPVPNVVVWSPDDFDTPPPRSSAILVLPDTTECPLDLSVHPEKTHASTTVGRVLVGKTDRWEANRHPGKDCSSAIPISPSVAWPKLAAAISPVNYDNLKKSPHEFRSLQNDPALFFLGAPSHYLADFQARQLAHIRERARHGHSYLGVRHTPLGVHSIRREERAILPDGTIYECQSTWIEDPRPRTKLSTRTQARGSRIDRDMARASSDSSN